MKIVWTEPAARALESIQDYIAKDNRRAAWEVSQKIRQTAILLKEHQMIGKGRSCAWHLKAGYSSFALYRALPGERERDSDIDRFPCSEEMASGF